jgi:lipoprotein-anchoring transpeptidase ErfK/SrfK
VRRSPGITTLVAVVLGLAPIACVASVAGTRLPARTTRRFRTSASSSKSPEKVSLDPAIVNDEAVSIPVRRGDRGAAVLRAQVLLARAHLSCGEIDAQFGSNLGKAVAEFQKSRGMEENSRVDAATWQALNEDRQPVLVTTPIAPKDVSGPFVAIPDGMMEKAKLPAMSFASLLEALSEKYHLSPALMTALNPGVALDSPGASVEVPDVLVPPPGPAAAIVVSKTRRVVEALDRDGRIIASYPASVGSDHDPLPVGTWKILGVSRNPVFHYDPRLFWNAKPNDEKAVIAPGPNNPVGVAWIDLSKAHYGIHGTPEPATIGKTQSHGCIRLTNWDVWELQQMVKPGTPARLED